MMSSDKLVTLLLCQSGTASLGFSHGCIGPKDLSHHPLLSQATSKDMSCKCSNLVHNLAPVWDAGTTSRGLAYFGTSPMRFLHNILREQNLWHNSSYQNWKDLFVLVLIQVKGKEVNQYLTVIVRHDVWHFYLFLSS